MSLNLSPLLYSTVHEPDTFLFAITLEDTDFESLMRARTELRDGLRKCLREEVAKLTGNVSESVTPKFVTQGSVSYKTLNEPCRPPQQADLDDGIYLPLSYVQDKGQPGQAADTLFEAVAERSRRVAEEKGWTVHTRNPRCIRVEVSASMHIDIPVYSIPDDEFSRLIEARTAAAVAKAYHTREEEEELDWDEVASDRVLLATRNEGWLPKDPRPIRDWVEQRVKAKGEQLRRVMRYVKAWRDFQTWGSGHDPKSIMLMVAVEQAFEGEVPKRDDLALLAVARKMAEIVQGALQAPWDRTEDLTRRLDDCPGLRADLSNRLRVLAAAIDYAINTAHTASNACQKLQEAFGTRMPHRPDLVLMGTITSTSAIASSAPGSVGRQNNA